VIIGVCSLWLILCVALLVFLFSWYYDGIILMMTVLMVRCPISDWYWLFHWLLLIFDILLLFIIDVCIKYSIFCVFCSVVIIILLHFIIIFCLWWLFGYKYYYFVLLLFQYYWLFISWYWQLFSGILHYWYWASIITVREALVVLIIVCGIVYILCYSEILRVSVCLLYWRRVYWCISVSIGGVRECAAWPVATEGVMALMMRVAY